MRPPEEILSRHAASATVPLAVVIPAYRATYFAATLRSLAAQTSRAFRLYIADDASPEPLHAIVGAEARRIDHVYHRFPENLGRTSLVRHWDRAVRLTCEPWVWLFSDDDVAAPECVAALVAELERAPDTLALRRFDLEFLDAGGGRIEVEAPFPAAVSAGGYVDHLLHAPPATCCIQNMVFRRAVYDAEQGFTDLPGGYCSDYATWPRFARHGGVRRIGGGRVGFRRHGAQLSVGFSCAAVRGREVLAGYGRTLRVLRDVAGPARAAQAAYRRAELRWYGRWFRYSPHALGAGEGRFVAEELRALWPRHPVASRVAVWGNHAATVLRRYRLGSRLLAWRRWLVLRRCA